MNTRLFGELIEYVARNEGKGNFCIWGKRIPARLLGFSKTFSYISLEESINTNRDYIFIKRKLHDADLDDQILLCERGIKKYEEVSIYFQFFKALLVAVFALFLSSINYSEEIGISKLKKENASAISTICNGKSNKSECKETWKDGLSHDVERARSFFKAQAFVILLVGSICIFLVITIISNDNKGKTHLEILMLYLTRLKAERDKQGEA